MHKVTITHSGYRLNVTLSGMFDIDATKRAFKDTLIASRRLKDSFDVVVDIRNLKPEKNKLAKVITRMTMCLEERGAENIIRVVGSSVYALTLFAINSKKTTKVKLHYVPTLADADKIIKEAGTFKNHES